MSGHKPWSEINHKGRIYDGELEFYFKPETRRISASCPKCKATIELAINPGMGKVLAPCPDCLKIFLVTKIWTTVTQIERSGSTGKILVGICPFCNDTVRKPLGPDGSFDAKMFCNSFQREYYLSVEASYDYKRLRIYTYQCELKPWNDEKIHTFFFAELDGTFSSQVSDGFVFTYNPRSIITAIGEESAEMVATVNTVKKQVIFSITARCRLEEAMVPFKQFISKLGQKAECNIIPRAYEKKEIINEREQRVISKINNLHPELVVDDNGRELEAIILPKPKKEYNC